MNATSLPQGSLLRFGQYRIDRMLGRGGFGITYLATNLTLEKEVCIKEFFPKAYCSRDATTSHVTVGSPEAADFVARLKAKFLKEARNIARFRHPNIIPIFDAFEENNTAYYVMEYVEGESLAERVRRDGPLPRAEALRYVQLVGQALQTVHAEHMMHLDVKPANIMLRRSDGCPVLIDFGLSKQYDAGGKETTTTPVGISNGYAPIEQYQAGGVSEFSPATDEYALAATLYFLLTEQVPPQATALVSRPLTFPPSFPKDLQAAVARAMSSSRSGRFGTVGEFVAALAGKGKEDARVDDEETELPPQQPEWQQPPQLTPQPTPAKRKWPKWLWPVAAAVVAFVALIVWRPWREQMDPAWETGKTREVKKTEAGTENGYDWVDLGLSVKWATKNVGASSPSDFGDYFAWGEIVPKAEYTMENCETWEKKLDDIAGNPAYDAARANWSGDWRLPTMAEWQELSENCTWKWTSQDGHEGFFVTSKKNGRSIFLPAAGYRTGTSLCLDGDGRYWGSTPLEGDIQGACRFCFYDSYWGADWDGRLYGLTVRAVRE